MGYNMANPTGPNRGMSPGVNDHHEPGPNCTEECQPGLSEPTDPQTRAADMMASFFWAHSPEYVDHVAAKLAEAGLLADPEERSRLIAAHQKAARFADQNYEQRQKAEVERDAAREELDAANEALAVADAQYKADTEALDAARAELAEVKAERDSHLAALVAQGRVTDRLTRELRDACDDRGAVWRAYEIALQTGAEWQTRAEKAEAEREKWETRYRKVIGERNRETERAKKAEAELAALREGVRALAGDMRSRELDPWYWSEIADEIDALLGEDQ